MMARIRIVLILAILIVPGLVTYAVVRHNTNIYQRLTPEEMEMREAGGKPALSYIVDGDEYEILVNREYILPADYVPEDLRAVDISFMPLAHPERALMRDKAASALERMFADAAREGIYLLGISGYRSYESQMEIYQNGSDTGDTDLYIARPGTSEHQTGLAMDIGCANADRLSEDFAYTREGQWVEENAHRYGFIIRYPRDGEDATGYGWEPWHIRYVGEAAEEIRESGVVLEAFAQS